MEGEIVECGHCGVGLYALTRDVDWDTSLRASLFDPLGSTPLVVDGEQPQCPRCQYPWFPQWWAELSDGDYRTVKVLAA